MVSEFFGVAIYGPGETVFGIDHVRMEVIEAVVKTVNAGIGEHYSPIVTYTTEPSIFKYGATSGEMIFATREEAVEARVRMLLEFRTRSS